MCQKANRKNAPTSLAKVARLALLVGLGAVLVGGTAQAQVWTGEELLTSGDWVEMSYADGPNGPRTYSVEGTSLRWESGFRFECGIQCQAERTFRLPLPAGCVGPFSVAYHYTLESSDNDFLVGVGNATLMVQTTTAVNRPMRISRSSFSGLGDPAYNGFVILAGGDPITPPVGGEVWVETTYDLRPGYTWLVNAVGSSTSHPNPTMVSTGTSPLGEPLYIFLATGDRNEQLLFHSITLDGCGPENLIGNLIAFVESVVLHGGIENALVSKLENALASFETGNATAAVNKLEAFKNQVEAQAGKKIDAGDAQRMLDAANAIIALLD